MDWDGNTMGINQWVWYRFRGNLSLILVLGSCLFGIGCEVPEDQAPSFQASQTNQNWDEEQVQSQLDQLQELKRDLEALLHELEDRSKEIRIELDETMTALEQEKKDLDQIQQVVRQGIRRRQTLRDEIKLKEKEIVKLETELHQLVVEQRTSEFENEAILEAWRVFLDLAEGEGSRGRLGNLEGKIKTLKSQIKREKDSLNKLKSELTFVDDITWVELALTKRRGQKNFLISQKALEPTVQLDKGENAGAAVIVKREKLSTDSGYRYLVITAFHTLRNFGMNVAAMKSIERSDQSNDQKKSFYQFQGVYPYVDGERQTVHQGDVIAYHKNLDAAFIEFTSDLELSAASLPHPEVLRTIHLWDEVVLIGCPLGLDPYLTRGEITDLNHVYDGKKFQLVSAPAYYGNSGGGAYLLETGQLIGILSKVYTHGHYKPEAVPHLAVLVPLGEIYAWVRRDHPMLARELGFDSHLSRK